MKNVLFYLISLPALIPSAVAQQSLAQFEALQSLPKTYAIPKTEQPIIIDGRNDEATWQNAPWTDLFVDIQGDSKPTPTYPTQVKMTWDQEYLYIYAELKEPHIWGNLVNHDDIIYHNNDFEVFIKPNVHQSEYYEVEINALNTIFDLLLSKPYRFGGNALTHWDLKGLKSAVHLEGTLNNAKDIDKYWAVEMAIPFQSLRPYGPKMAPKIGDYWQINFSRVQWHHDLEDGKYSKRKVNGKTKEEENWVWSPIGVINMHFPERWGYVQFVEHGIDTPPALPSYYLISKLAWNIHYLQGLYVNSHQTYAHQLSLLPRYEKYIQPLLNDYEVELLTDSKKNYYSLLLRSKTNKALMATIDSKGNFDTHF